MKFVTEYNFPKAKAIASRTDSPCMKDVHFIPKAKFYSKNKFIMEFVDDIGFYCGIFGKNHFRLLEIAVDKQFQGNGIGSKMIQRIVMLCKRKNIRKITLRTSRDESAWKFYKKFGAKIVGIAENDYEMEIRF